jgi:hypothetical protein
MQDGASFGETIMIRKILLGLVAATSISAAALAPTAASAHHFGGGFGGGFGHGGFHRFGGGFGHRFGGGFGGPVSDPCLVVTANGVLVNVCN